MLSLGLGSDLVHNHSLVPDFFIEEFDPGPVAAYSLRKLSMDFTGSPIRVRRTVDNVESDIGFAPDGSLDVDALASFAAHTGGTYTNLRVTTWYDQVGSNNLIQATTSQQPKIFDGATVSVEDLNGRPCIKFTASSQEHLENSTNYSASPTASSVFFVAQTTQKSGSGNFVSMVNFRNIFRMTLAPSGVTPDNYSKYSISTNNTAAEYVRFLTGQTGDHVQQTCMVSWDGSSTDSGTGVDSVELYLNGSSQSQTFSTNGFGTLASGNILNGHSGGNDGQSGDANWQELLIYTYDKSFDVTAMHENAKSFYLPSD